ncbi:hypothetical protein SAMD00019534_045590, partial [Acytostelium subglobosum LB1]|uniref:hypothetical protein n=1 Tax=Acytostelium subglobosum LB1 TaxID=1410327 RepID=UPI00064482D5
MDGQKETNSGNSTVAINVDSPVINNVDSPVINNVDSPIIMTEVVDVDRSNGNGSGVNGSSNNDKKTDSIDVDSTNSPISNIDQDRNTLRSMWQLPSVQYFITVFKDALHIKVPIYIDDLENALLEPANDDSKTLLADLFMPVLRGLVKGPITATTWEKVLKVELGKRTNVFHKNPFGQGDHFTDVNISNRLLAIKCLCDLHMSKTKSVLDQINNNPDLDAMRPESIGKDEEGRLIWFFDDGRLYREAPPPPRGTPSKSRKSLDGKDRRWEVVCSTKEEWVEFVNSLAGSTDDQVKELHSLLDKEIMPLGLAKIQNYKKLVTKKEREKNRETQLAHRAVASLALPPGYRQFRSPRLLEQNLKKLEAERLEKERRKQLGLPDDEPDEEDDDDNDEDNDEDYLDDDEEQVEAKTKRVKRVPIVPLRQTSSGRRIIARKVDQNGMPLLSSDARRLAEDAAMEEDNVEDTMEDDNDQTSTTTTTTTTTSTNGHDNNDQMEEEQEEDNKEDIDADDQE